MVSQFVSDFFLDFDESVGADMVTFKDAHYARHKAVFAEQLVWTFLNVGRDLQYYLVKHEGCFHNSSWLNILFRAQRAADSRWKCLGHVWQISVPEVLVAGFRPPNGGLQEAPYGA